VYYIKREAHICHTFFELNEMSVLVDIEGYESKGIKIDPNGTEGEAVELHGLLVVLPKKPQRI